MAIGIATALLGGAILGGGASLLAGGAQADAAGDAAALSAAATREAVAENRRQFELSREDLAPYRDTGVNALSQYAALYGISDRSADEPQFLDEQFQTGTEQYLNPAYTAAQGGFGGYRTGDAIPAPSAPQYLTRPTYSTRQVENEAYDPNGGFLSTEDMQAARDRFKETPGYQFRFEEGERALNRNASARGRLKGGGHEREVIRYGQGIASDEFNNYANRLAGIAGMGQGATVTTATLGAQSAATTGNFLLSGAQQQGQNILAAGTARASGFAGAGNAATGGIENFLLASQAGVL